MPLPRLAPVVLLALAASAASARGDALGLIVGGEPAKQPVVESTLEPWLAQRGFEARRVADQKVSDKLLDCFMLTEPRCAEGMVASLKLPRTLFVMVEVHHDAKSKTDEVKLTGWLYDEKGLAIASQSVFCRACTNATLGPNIEELAKSLFAAGGEGAGRIRVSTTPAGAAVVIDGSKVGATPWEQGVLAGTHTVKVELPGHRPELRTVDVKKDATETIDIALVRSEVGGGPTVRPKWPLALVGAGVLVAAGGGVLLALDEDCTADDGCPGGPSKEQYLDSAPLGVGALGVGVALLGAGAYFYFTGGETAPASATAWIDPGRGGGLGLTGRF